MLESRRSRGFSAVWPLSMSHTASDLVIRRLLSTISSVVLRRRSIQLSGSSFSSRM